MGIYDREYYRDDSPSGFELRGGWSMPTRLVVVTVGFFLLNIILKPDEWQLWRQLSATPASLTKPYLWWQLISYGFVHDPSNVGHILWNMFALWVFGRSVESIYGPKEFLRIYLASIFVGGLFWASRALVAGSGGTLLGASGAVTAITLLFCIHFPKQTILLMFVLPVPAWFLGAMIIVFNLLDSLTGREGVAVDVHLVGALFAICYVKFGWNLGYWLSGLSFPRSLFQRRPRLRVHHPANDSEHDQLAEQADQLLEKINQHGIDSLTDKERRILEKHSRRIRDRRS